MRLTRPDGGSVGRHPLPEIAANKLDAEEGTTVSTRPTPASCAALSILLLFLAVRCGDETGGEATQRPEERSTNVVTFGVRADTLTRYSYLPATAAAWQAVTVSVLEGGVVEEVLKDLGDPVDAGEVMALLRGEVLEARAIQAEADLKFRRYDHERARKLHKEGSIPEHDLVAAEYQLKRAESEARATRTRLGFLEVKAPFAGAVARRGVELGQLVATGSPAFDIVQTDSIRVKAWVPENQIADYREGNPVQVTFDTYPEIT